MPDIIHPDDKATCQQEWEKVFRHGQELRDFEYRIIDGTGDTRWVAHTSRLVKAGNRIIGMQNTIRDITERKRSEGQLRR